jgi:hypothetical protein
MTCSTFVLTVHKLKQLLDRQLADFLFQILQLLPLCSKHSKIIKKYLYIFLSLMQVYVLVTHAHNSTSY